MSLSEIDYSISLGIQWIKRTFIKRELGWARSREDYEESKRETGYGCNPCSTAESVEILAYLGEPLHSEFIRKGLAWFILNQDKWLEQRKSVDFLIWALHALRLSNSKIASNLLDKGILRIKKYQITDPKEPSLKNLIVEDAVFPQPKKEPLKVKKWGLYSTALTIKLYAKLLTQFHLEHEIKLLKEPLLHNYNRKEKGWPIYPVKIAEEQNVENPVDVFYTALIVDSFLDSEEPLSSIYVSEPLQMIKDKQLKSGGWSGIWPQKEHGIETKYGDTETTSQVIVTLLKSGVPPDSKLVRDGIQFILGNQVREEECPDFGGFCLFRKEELDTVYNFSTFMALMALDFYKCMLQYAESVKKARIKERLETYEYATLAKQIVLRRMNIENNLPSFFINHMKTKGHTRRLRILKHIDKNGPVLIREFRKDWAQKEKVDRGTINNDIQYLMDWQVVTILKENANEYLWTLYDIKE